MTTISENFRLIAFKLMPNWSKMRKNSSDPLKFSEGPKFFWTCKKILCHLPFVHVMYRYRIQYSILLHTVNKGKMSQDLLLNHVPIHPWTKRLYHEIFYCMHPWKRGCITRSFSVYNHEQRDCIKRSFTVYNHEKEA